MQKICEGDPVIQMRAALELELHHWARVSDVFDRFELAKSIIVGAVE